MCKIGLPVEAQYYSTIYPNFWSPSSLAWVQRTQACLRPNPHIGWPSGLRPSAKRILHWAASLAAAGYNRPCGPIKSLFILSPARILDGRARLYSSELSYEALYSTELSYSYCLDHHLHQPRSSLIGSLVQLGPVGPVGPCRLPLVVRIGQG